MLRCPAHQNRQFVFDCVYKTRLWHISYFEAGMPNAVHSTSAPFPVRLPAVQVRQLLTHPAPLPECSAGGSCVGDPQRNCEIETQMKFSFYSVPTVISFCFFSFLNLFIWKFHIRPNPHRLMLLCTVRIFPANWALLYFCLLLPGLSQQLSPLCCSCLVLLWTPDGWKGHSVR